MPRDSSDYNVQRRVSFAGHGGRSLHSMLGGGKVADILLWRNQRLSAVVLIAATAIWFLFEVVEYSFVTLLCHFLIAMMLLVFVWYNGAELINWNPPNVHDFELSKSTLNSLFAKINWLLVKFCDVSSGKDMKLFIIAIVSLWILSGIGTYVSSLNLLYLGFLCLETLPALYGRYKEEVDYMASKGNQDMKKLYRKFDTGVLNKIPRGPVKQKKSF